MLLDEGVDWLNVGESSLLSPAFFDPMLTKLFVDDLPAAKDF